MENGYGTSVPDSAADEMTEAEYLNTQMIESDYLANFGLNVSDQSAMYTPWGMPAAHGPWIPLTAVAATAEYERVVKVKTGNDLLKFVLPNPTMDNLKAQVLKRKPELAADVLKFMYKDEEGEMITITSDEDLHFCSQYFKSSTSIRLSLVANDNH
ncbi:PREDICTED: uncharacterized protein LOC109179291 [Ipomoea nil]|uniref:uncharacterized protein LOC109179291 n=1 Tax=Ipomoea nil TaxID=35883 RepID=UPI000901E5C5|nr:PREDICTED: uncharacterized protein LOC109179291 [Ipomoea nil]